MTEEITEAGGKLRLYVSEDLRRGAADPAREGQAHYLLHVMRAKTGMRVSLFNGRDGEWLAEIGAAGKRGVTLTLPETDGAADGCARFVAGASPRSRKLPADYLTQKATELGVSLLQPVMTRRTIVARVNQERMAANAIEAAEQSGRLSVPEIRQAMTLEKLLAAGRGSGGFIFVTRVVMPLAFGKSGTS